MAIAVHSHCTPAAVDSMPILDGFAIMDRINRREKFEANFQALLHGKRIS